MTAGGTGGTAHQEGPSAYDDLEARARQSKGSSAEPIYAMVARALSERGIRGDTFIDVGCGGGGLRSCTRERFERHLGVDAVRYAELPADVDFHMANLDTTGIPLPDGSGDVVAAVETIEHLENPRAFVRELVRLARPGGWVIVTTPNQLSALSLLTLLVKRRFSAFQDVHYPAHITALLEVDLRRVAAECGLEEVQVAYSLHGRIVLTARNYPRHVARLAPRLLSDNLLLIGRKPA